MNKPTRLKSASAVIALAMGWLIFQSAALAAGGGSETSPANVRPLPAEIQTWIDNGEFDRALDALTDFVGHETENADAWNLLGYSQRKTGLLDASLVSYKKALRLDKKHLGAHEYIGELYLILNKVKKAKKHLARLKRYCGRCDEYLDLEEAIDEYLYLNEAISAKENAAAGE